MPHRTEHNGFTLMEVLVALLTFSIILTMLYSTFFIASRAASSVDHNLLRLHEARTALDVMGREVESSLKSGLGASITIKDRDIFGAQTSRLEMITFASPLPGPARVGYHVYENEEDGSLILVKRLGPALEGLEGESEMREAPVIEGIESFDVEVKVKGRWLRTWQAETGPEALRIVLTVRAGGKTIRLVETLRTEL